MNKLYTPTSIPNDTTKALSIMKAYFTCAKWTEEIDNFDGEVDKESWNKVYRDCYKFVESILNSKEYKESKFFMDWNNEEMISQMGHDLWLTRNGHGTGFWDREEIWGSCSELFSQLSRSLGEMNCYQENDLLFFD